MTTQKINDINVPAASPWRELEQAEHRLSALVAERPDATVRELADELTEVAAGLADARSTLEAAAQETGDRRREAQLERLVEAMLPAEVPPSAAVWHAHRTAEARVALLREFGAWSAAEVAERAGSSASNRSALASAWRAAGRALAVDWHGRPVYPAFQFGPDGQPRPVITRVLAQLARAGLTDWQAALWFASPTGWLDDRRPVDLLDDDPEAVERAASAFDQRPT
jgi:hypothetical protein